MHPEVLLPEAARLAPGLCLAISGMAFTLAGGTGLALQLGHRISADFDWFCAPEDFPRDMGKILYAFDPSLQVLQDKADTFECLMGGVKCSFFRFDGRFGAPEEFLHGVPIAPVVDIAAMKLIAISQRGARKDFYDLYEVLQNMAFRDVAQRVATMYAHPSPNPLHISKSLVYFDDAELDPEPRMLKRVAWAAVRSFFVQHVGPFTNTLVEVIVQS